MHEPPPNALREYLDGSVEPDEILQDFVASTTARGLTLYPAQEEAVLELLSGKNLILATPTGSGKSLVATALHFKAMREGKRSFYTCPIKALVSEKFFQFCEEFGPENVGMMTGDASVNRDAKVICCTAEILANMALREGEDADVSYVVMDEFHYYAEPERGVAWQVPLLTLPQATFLLMSATLGPTERFEEALSKLNGRETAVVRSMTRPVPLDYTYRETPLHETISDLIRSNKAPIYVVSFTHRECAEEAQNLMSVDLCTKAEKAAIHDALRGVHFTSPYGKDVQRYLRHGVGLHHAGLLPKYRRAVERLAQRGMLKIICGTDTLGVGVNVPIRSVLFTKLCKFDGEKVGVLSVRDFQQIAGRAGRKGFDTQGSVVAQAPEHVVENLRAEAKATGNPAKKKKIVKKGPPDKGYAHWDRTTFERLSTSQPEPLVSRFRVSTSMLLNVLGRQHGGCAAMKQLVRTSHDGPSLKRQHRVVAMAQLRSLVGAGIVEFAPREGTRLKKLRVSGDLQLDFSLNQALSLYVVETLPKLDPTSREHALDVVTLVESTLENPDMILIKQLDRLKRDKVMELKAAGVEYEERMAELEKLEHPKPRRDFVYETFNAFAARHPWVGRENIRPKSIAREMFEGFYSFAEYVKEYELQRGEGLLLRYLTDAYKALVQTVPEAEKTEELQQIIDYLGTIVRSIDASLIDEWERMRAGETDEQAVLAPVPEEDPDVTRDLAAFALLVRNEAFRVVRAAALGRHDDALEGLEPGGAYASGAQLADALRAYYDEHERIDLGHDARNKKSVRIVPREGGRVWDVEQALYDAEGATDWAMTFSVELDRSRDAGRALLRLERVGALEV